MRQVFITGKNDRVIIIDSNNYDSDDDGDIDDDDDDDSDDGDIDDDGPIIYRKGQRKISETIRKGSLSI